MGIGVTPTAEIGAHVLGCDPQDVWTILGVTSDRSCEYEEYPANHECVVGFGGLLSSLNDPHAVSLAIADVDRPVRTGEDAMRASHAACVRLPIGPVALGSIPREKR